MYNSGDIESSFEEQDFVPWPVEEKARYEKLGAWRGETLDGAFDARVRLHPEAIALVGGARRWTYLELQQCSLRLANALHERGLDAGDYVVLQLPNCAEFFVCLLACLRLGVIPVLALQKHRRHEMEEYVRQTRAKAYFGPARYAGFDYSEMVRSIHVKHSNLDTIVFWTPREQDWTPCAQSLRALRLATLLTENHSPTRALRQSKSPDGVALLQLSGGSTGTPKLIPRTHADYLYSIERSIEICGFDRSTRYLAVLPLAHNFTLSSPGTLGTLFAGGVVILSEHAHATHAFFLIEREFANVTAAVPSILRVWLTAAKHPGFRTRLESLEHILVGGAPLDVATAQQVEGTLGVRLQQVYGMAEGLVCYTRLDDDEVVRTSTQGLPMSEHDEVLVVNEDGIPVEIGETGELCVRGPYTIRGYFRAAQYNRKAFSSDGFYRSGDLVARDSDGRIVVRGRIKEQINRAGEKISTCEIEELLLRHPDVHDAALVAIPDAYLGEKSCAALVLKTSPHDVEVFYRDDAHQRAIRNYLRELEIAEYKIPDMVVIFREFPLSAVGKINKRRLVQLIVESLPCT